MSKRADFGESRELLSSLLVPNGLFSIRAIQHDAKAGITDVVLNRDALTVPENLRLALLAEASNAGTMADILSNLTVSDWNELHERCVQAVEADRRHGRDSVGLRPQAARGALTEYIVAKILERAAGRFATAGGHAEGGTSLALQKNRSDTVPFGTAVLQFRPPSSVIIVGVDCANKHIPCEFDAVLTSRGMLVFVDGTGSPKNAETKLLHLRELYDALIQKPLSGMEQPPQVQVMIVYPGKIRNKALQLMVPPGVPGAFLELGIDGFEDHLVALGAVLQEHGLKPHRRKHFRIGVRQAMSNLREEEMKRRAA